MFTNYKSSVFTCLDFYEQEQTPALQELKEKFKKKSRRKQTLIFEMVGTMIKLLDPAIDVYSMQDQSIRQFTALHEGNKEIIYAKFYSQPLVKVIQLLQAHYEIIIFTVLPRRFLDEIVAQIPGLRSVVNYFLCLEDTQEKEEYVVKDISIFLKNREL